MNRYPLWKYILIGITLFVAMIYTIPNFYGESPAVQVSAGKATVKIDESMTARVEKVLADAKLTPNGVFFEQGAQQNTVRVRFDPSQGEQQLKAREALERELNPDREDPGYIVAPNLVPNTPQWLLSIRALPMYLGLDLRGGVHFLLQVDMRSAIQKRAESTAADLRK
ncbi:MAG: protein translocase subunit SecD, partial [Duodenibacillus sp.]|nr:protein translocase subunit SecD [Duodenibacillus sp.]